jgi:L-amino acid N-acyltransferase YncA
MQPMEFAIRPMTAEDWPAVRAIYGEGISTGNATFATDLPDWQAWDSSHRPNCRLVASKGIKIFGWAALSAVSARQVYAGVAEVSIYVTASARGVGIGKALLQALIHESERSGIWTLQAGIFPENVASLSLHRSLSFREVGVREKIGQLAGQWRDVQLLERRSSIAGT